MNLIVKKDTELKNIYTENSVCAKEHKATPEAPIMMYNGYIVPGEDESAKKLGEKCVDELKKNIIADFERTEEYCREHNEDSPDLMVHVSTFKIQAAMPRTRTNKRRGLRFVRLIIRKI